MSQNNIRCSDLHKDAIPLINVMNSLELSSSDQSEPIPHYGSATSSTQPLLSSNSNLLTNSTYVNSSITSCSNSCQGARAWPSSANLKETDRRNPCNGTYSTNQKETGRRSPCNGSCSYNQREAGIRDPCSRCYSTTQREPDISKSGSRCYSTNHGENENITPSNTCTHGTRTETYSTNPGVVGTRSSCEPSHQGAWSNFDFGSGTQSSDYGDGIVSNHDNTDDIRWPSVNRRLRFNIDEGSPDASLWRKIALTMYDKIEDWETEEILGYKCSRWDFCVLHTDDEIDVQIANEFLKHLELEGFVGTSVNELEINQEALETCQQILRGSKFIFILDSFAFTKQGIHHLQYQHVLMKKIILAEWKRKLIPLHPSDADVQRYKDKHKIISWTSDTYASLFGLETTRGIFLGDRTYTINQVRRILTTDLQELNDKGRRRAKEMFRVALNCHKESKCKNLQTILNTLKQQWEHLNYSTEFLARVCLEIENLPTESLFDDDLKQMNILKNCSNVSIGPSFHINVSPQGEFD